MGSPHIDIITDLYVCVLHYASSYSHLISLLSTVISMVAHEFAELSGYLQP